MLAKLYENRYLTYEQVDWLKTAQAIFEVVPVAIYLPYLFLMMRQVLRANTAKKYGVCMLTLTMTLPWVEGAQVYMKERLYWPIV